MRVGLGGVLFFEMIGRVWGWVELFVSEVVVEMGLEMGGFGGLDFDGAVGVLGLRGLDFVLVLLFAGFLISGIRLTFLEFRFLFIKFFFFVGLLREFS